MPKLIQTSPFMPRQAECYVALDYAARVFIHTGKLFDRTCDSMAGAALLLLQDPLEAPADNTADLLDPIQHRCQLVIRVDELFRQFLVERREPQI